MKGNGMNTEERKKELRRRTKEFAGSVVDLFIKLDRRRDEVAILGKQLIRSATSVAAQYREASRARSPEEFIAKIEACVQEADESQLWLELLRDDCEISPSLIDPIWKEADELISIFIAMSKNTKTNRSKKEL
jgi:four helix bundle protein